MKKYIIVFALAIMAVWMSGCTYEQTVDQKQKVQQEQMQQDMNNQIGLPDIKEWSEKKMTKEIFELRDNSKLVTYAYIKNVNGKFVFIGQCVGFGLPYSVQYTNPQRLARNSETSSSGNITLPQADPNGLFMPEGLAATWLQYINPETGKREVMYVEDNVTVSQSKLPKRLVEDWSLPKDY